MRLIDADALFRAIKNSDWLPHERIEAMKMVREQLTIDAASVVLCKDCRHYHADTLSCDFTPHAKYYERPNWYEDDFCSYGERKDGAT